MDAARALQDPSLTVPDPGPAGPPGSLAWLRATVSRFARGEAHARRRALVVAELDRLDPDGLRQRAGVLAPGAPEQAAVRALAEALGAPDAAADAALVARYYLDPAGAGPDADHAVACLVAALGGTADEATAARISVLVQASAGTAALTRSALRFGGPAEEAVAEALAEAPPVPATRRIAPSGETIRVDLAGMPFGAGPRACPGREHALALVAGAVEGAR
jgi:hypothetical protein